MLQNLTNALRIWRQRIHRWTAVPRAILGWFPLTARSILAFALSWWVYAHYGVERSDLILRVVGLGGMVLTGVAVLVVVLVAAVMRLRHKHTAGDPWIFSTELPFHTGFALKASAWIPLVQIDLAWEAPEEVELEMIPTRGKLVESITAHRRVETDHFVRKFQLTDAFGLARITYRVRLQQEIRIQPIPGKIAPRSLLQQLATGDLFSHPGGDPEGDLIEMRRYAHGDPLKHILWKAYARTRKLLVRQPERAIAPRQKTLVYFVAASRDEASASIARAALEQGVFGEDFLFRADGSSTSTNLAPEAIHQIVRSASVAERGGEGLGDFLQEERGASKACLVFAPPCPGPWLQRVQSAASQHRGRLNVVVGVDGLQTGSRNSWLRALLFSSPARKSYTLQDLREVGEKLQGTGAQLTIIDRGTGQPLSSQQLQHLGKVWQKQGTPALSLST